MTGKGTPYRPAEDHSDFYSDSKKTNFKHRKRRRIYERDGNKCVKCGTTEYLTLDHIIPKSKGGTFADSNLQTMCENCNAEKADKIE